VDLLFNTIGTFGVLLMLAAYGLLQRGKLHMHDLRYLWMNLSGALLVLVSLYQAWNLPAFLIESAWAAISAYSILTVKKKT